MKSASQYTLFSTAFGIGCLITIMITFNGRLAQEVSHTFSLLVIHIAGGLVVAAVLIIRRLIGRASAPSGRRLPWYFWIGGGIGVVMVFGNNVCFAALGVSLTMAAGILGQTAGSIIIDATGFLGMSRYRFIRGKFIGLGIIVLGVLLMVDNWRFDGFFILFAFAVGILTIVQMTINSQLAASIGIIPGTGINYLGGFLAALAGVLLTGTSLTSSFAQLPEVPLYLVLGGGFTGFLIVSGVNTILPKIPTFYSSLLIFLGQISAAVVADALLLGIFSYQRLFASALILAGIAANLIADRRATPAEAETSVSSP